MSAFCHLGKIKSSAAGVPEYAVEIQPPGANGAGRESEMELWPTPEPDFGYPQLWVAPSPSAKAG
jgi:hypothetical protein